MTDKEKRDASMWFMAGILTMGFSITIILTIMEL